MSQWPKWLRRQYGKLEICGSCPGCDTNFSLKNYHLCSFSNLYIISPTPKRILQPFRRFIYVTAHSPKPSVASPTSQLILQAFRRFTYVTAHSPTLLSLLPRHRLFTYITWRATHGARAHRGAALVLFSVGLTKNCPEFFTFLRNFVTFRVLLQ